MDDYASFHRNRANLIIHVFAVPLFVLSALAFLAGAVRLELSVAAAGALGMVIAMALQGVGHKREPNPPVPFAGPADVFKRIFAEQFYKFPRFVLTGKWWASLRGQASVPSPKAKGES